MLPRSLSMFSIFAARSASVNGGGGGGHLAISNYWGGLVPLNVYGGYGPVIAYLSQHCQSRCQSQTLIYSNVSLPNYQCDLMIIRMYFM